MMLGGPALVPNGGTIESDRYVFGANQGLSVENALADPGNYSIELTFTLDATSGYRRLISFKNATDEFGLYTLNSQLYFYPRSAGPRGVIAAGEEITVRLTRDAATKEIVGYVDGQSSVLIH